MYVIHFQILTKKDFFATRILSTILLNVPHGSYFIEQGAFCDAYLGPFKYYVRHSGQACFTEPYEGGGGSSRVLRKLTGKHPDS